MSAEDPERKRALDDFRSTLLTHREWESKLKNLRKEIKSLSTEFDTTEDNIKALQSVGQIIGEVLKQLDEERCRCSPTLCCKRMLMKPHSYCQRFVCINHRVSSPGVSNGFIQLPPDPDMSSDAGQRSTRRSSSREQE